jgi:hypothetical protein
MVVCLFSFERDGRHERKGSHEIREVECLDQRITPRLMGPATERGQGFHALLIRKPLDHAIPTF